MSSRAIGRWLEAKGTKLSAATIARALRHPEPYWQGLADEVEPAARLFSVAYGIEIHDALESCEIVEATASRLIARGLPRVVRILGAVRIRSNDIAKLLEGGTK